MTLKKLFVLAVFTLTLCRLSAEENTNVEIYGIERGTNCGSPSSLYLRYKNISSEALDMQVWLERENKTWSVYTFLGAKPNESTGCFICKATGRYKYFSRPAGSSVKFPKPSEQAE